MISPEEFVERWGIDEILGGVLVRYELASLDNTGISDVDKGFLIAAGLPEDAAPYLGFEKPKFGTVPTISAAYSLPESFSNYRMIGSDGNGDPICIDVSRNGAIMALEHDGGFKPRFLNSSVPQLAESLVSYRDFVEQTLAFAGEDAILNNQIPPHMQAWIKAEIERIDPAALRDGCFWRIQLNQLETPW